MMIKKFIPLSLLSVLALSSAWASNENESDPQSGEQTVKVFLNASGGDVFVFEKGTLRKSSTVMIRTNLSGDITFIGVGTGRTMDTTIRNPLQTETIKTDLSWSQKNVSYATRSIYEKFVDDQVAVYWMGNEIHSPAVPKRYYSESQLAGVFIEGRGVYSEKLPLYNPKELTMSDIKISENLSSDTYARLKGKGISLNDSSLVVQEEAATSVPNATILHPAYTLTASEALEKLRITGKGKPDGANSNQKFFSLFDFDYSFLAPSQPKPDELADLKRQIAELTARIESLEAAQAKESTGVSSAESAPASTGAAEADSVKHLLE